MAERERISNQSISDDVGDLAEYIRSKLDATNMAEKERQQNKPTQPDSL
jgi:hypothetical protein